MLSFERAPSALLIAVLILAMIGTCFRAFSFGLEEEERVSAVNANGIIEFQIETSTQEDQDEVEDDIAEVNTGFATVKTNNAEIETLVNNQEEVETTGSYFVSNGDYSNLINASVKYSFQTTSNGKIVDLVPDLADPSTHISDDYVITVTSEGTGSDREDNFTDLSTPRTETVFIPISSSARPIQLEIVQNEQASIVLTSNTSSSYESHGQVVIKIVLKSSVDMEADGTHIAENLLMYEVLGADEDDDTDLVIRLQIALSKDNEGWQLWKIILVTIAAAVILTFVISVIAVCYRRHERRGRMEIMNRMKPILEEQGRPPLRRLAGTRSVGASADLIPKTRRTSPRTSQDVSYIVPHAQAAFPSSAGLPQYRSVPCTSPGYLYRMDDGELERISEERDESDTDDDENLDNGEQSIDEFHLVHHRPGRPLPSLPVADPYIGQMSRRRGPGKLIPLSASRHPHLTFAVVLVIVATVLGAVYTLTSFNRKHHLEIQVPEDLQIRQIRSYSRDRTLDVVSLERDVSSKTAVHLYDMRECHNELPKCKAFAVCDAFMMNYKCRCRTGYYASDGKCKVCSTSCPEASFMTSPCMERDDVICTPCTRCTGIQYEAASCSTTQDTLCIDVTFPAKGLLQSTTTSVDLDIENGLGDISVSSSPNCFIEQLGKLQDFESPLYFTNNQQKMGLTFQRPSGMEIKISFQDLYLLPEYRDLDHLGDNPYIRHSFRSTEDDKKSLDHAVKSFCRNPVPDSYHLGLKIITDRTTAASVITCDSHNVSLPRCPETYTDGKKYLHRSLNKNCSKAGHGVSKLNQLPNSIVCTDDNTLLLSVFKIQSKPARMRRFPSTDCAQANKECNHCIKTHTNCLNTSFSECCQVSCYSHDSCYKSYSKHCPSVPVECATGDVYLFTLEPNIRSLSNRFQCHLKRQDMHTLYQVEYSVFLPGINYHLHPRQKNITVDTSEPGFRSKGRFVADYLTLSHNIHIDIPDEVIVTGTYENSTVNRDITMYPLKTPSNPLSANYDIVNPKEGSFLMSVQFEKPFTYSSSSWWNNGCRKNISKMYSAESIYDSKNPVAVKATINKVGGMFQYQIQPRKKTPVIRLSIPGNQSVLSSYRDEGLATSLNSSALTAHLTRDWTRTVWIIQITGRLTVCPGYLSLEVHDKCSGRRLGRFDIMVDCPLDFSFVFDIPQKQSATFPAAFAVRITDMGKTYQFFLLSFQRPSFLPVNQDVARITVSDHMSPWKPALAIVFLMIAVLMLCSLVYVCMSRRKRTSKDKKIKEMSVRNDKNSTTYLNVHDLERMHGNMANLKTCRTMPASKFVSVFFIILYIIYSFLLTFTALFGLICFGIRSDLDSIVNSTRIKDDILNNFTHELYSMSHHESLEIARLLNLTIDRHRACSVHLDQELERIFDEIQNGSHIQMQIWESGSKHLKEALSKLVVTQASTYNKTLHEFLLKYNETLSYRMNNVFTRYKTYLDKVGRSAWIKFPKMLYRMFIKESRPRGFQKLDGSPGLVQWLGVDKIMDVVTNQENIRNRLFRDFPKIKVAEFSLSSWITESMFTQTQMYNLKNKPVVRNHLLKFITVENVTDPPTRLKFTIDMDTVISVSKTSQIANNLNDTQTTNDADNSSFAPLFYNLVLTSLCVFLICDVILLAYRFLWMGQIHMNLKNGFTMPLPRDQVSYHIYKTETGHYPCKYYAPRDHPYSYYCDSNNDSTWSSGDMYFFPQNVPKAKEDILREIWNHKKSLQPLRNSDKKKGVLSTSCCASLRRWFCRIATSCVTWKLIICALTICVICAILVFVDTFVTMDTVKYVFSANMLVPQLETHLNMTNGNLDNQARHLNIYLSDLNDQIDEEVRDINRLLEEMISHQGKLWHNLVEHACVVIEKSNTTQGQCDLRQYSLALTSTLMSCNFLPIAAQPYIGIQSGAFEELINSELFPLAEIMRNKLFYASYLVLLYAALFLLFHVICELIFKYLVKQSLVPMMTIYNTAHGVVSPALELQESNIPNTKLANHNTLWTADAPGESGVYMTDTDDSRHKESNV